MQVAYVTYAHKKKTGFYFLWCHMYEIRFSVLRFLLGDNVVTLLSQDVQIWQKSVKSCKDRQEIVWLCILDVLMLVL
jgi:hypothetical protein